MVEQGAIFSESWHRVAGLRIALRPALQIRKQYFRSEKWYVLQDCFDQRFYRFRPSAYQFLARLRPDRTVQEAWEECIASSPEDAPTQPEVIQLLSQLYQANLLQTELPPDSAKLFQRRQQREQRQLRATLMNLLFLKLPLWDPDAFLKKCVEPLKFLVTPWAVVVWLLVVLSGVKVALDHFPELRDQGAASLAPDSLALLYLTFIVTKAVHEFGHGFFCRAFGGEVHRLGVMLMVLNPMPYVDATASWAFRSRRQRILVSSGGMIFELFFAALAAWVWAYTGPGTLHRFAGNVMLIASVSTLLFNINPLIRFDGYYILSDLVDQPNLAMRAWQEVRFAFERWVCGVKKAVSTAGSGKERGWLIAYGLASAVYRIVIGAGIVLYIGNQFFELGLLLAAFFLLSWSILPLIRFVGYLANTPALQRHRARAWGITGATAVAVIGILGFVPMPHAFRAPGVIEAERFQQLFAPGDGFVEEVAAESGRVVEPNALLVRMSNPELELQLTQALAKEKELLALRESALSGAPAALDPLDKRLAALKKRLANLHQQQALLAIQTTEKGVWVAPHKGEWTGAWMARGTPLGELVNPEAFRFSAVVSQDEAALLFQEKMRKVEIRLKGQAGVCIPASIQRIVPARQDELPSAALGWRSGGEVAVRPGDESGRHTAEPFFKVLATVHPVNDALLLHRRSGQIRFELAPTPLAAQWWRRLLQLIQKRYHI